MFGNFEIAEEISGTYSIVDPIKLSLASFGLGSSSKIILQNDSLPS
jgi:hypothetical protein